MGVPRSRPTSSATAAFGGLTSIGSGGRKRARRPNGSARVMTHAMWPWARFTASPLARMTTSPRRTGTDGLLSPFRIQLPANCFCSRRTSTPAPERSRRSPACHSLRSSPGSIITVSIEGLQAMTSKSFRELVGASSLGSAEALAVRRRTPPDRAAALVRQSLSNPRLSSLAGAYEVVESSSSTSRSTPSRRDPMASRKTSAERQRRLRKCSVTDERRRHQRPPPVALLASTLPSVASRPA